MKKNKTASRIVLIFLVLFFCLLCFLLYILNELQSEEKTLTDIISEADISVTKEPQTIQEVIEKYESEYIVQERERIYVIFCKDLYDENGKSNEKFFKDIVYDLIPFFEKESFYLIDENKKITIFVEYDAENEKYNISINEVEDFYSKTDGESYVNVEKSEIANSQVVAITNHYLDKLAINSGYLSHIEEELGEGKELENGYISYLDDTIRIRTVPTGAVKNMIFTDKYVGDITYKINSEMTLEEIKEKHSKNVFGSIEKGYLGYRERTYYLFFYEDEVSAYTYSYKENKTFEKALSQYLESKDLDKFVNTLLKKWKAYDSFEYNPETQSLKMLYSTRGVEIDIKENDAKGITFFSNYYFTDYTKTLVKNGTVSFNGKVDLVEKTEIERRNKNN